MFTKFYLFVFAVLALSCTANNTEIVPPDNRPNPKQTSIVELCGEIQEKWEQNEEVSRIYICAHRANTNASYIQGIPDNSLPNIEKAIELGVDMIEVDVRTTLDGELVLMHNETINETTEGSGKVSELTLAQIKSYKMKKNGKVYRDTKGEYTYVPTLKEALALTKDKVYVNLDLAGKGNDPAKVWDAIREAGVQDQVMLYGVSASDYVARYPLIAVHPYISSPNDVLKYSDVIGAKLFQYSNQVYLNNTIPQFGTQVHLLGCLSYSNLLNSYDIQMRDEGNYSALDKFIVSGSDFVQTDYFELVDAYLKKQGLR